MRQTRLLWALSLVVLLAAVAGPLADRSPAEAAGTARFRARADAHVNLEKPKKTLGQRSRLLVGAGKRAYLRFHVRHLSQRVVKATLSFRTGKAHRGRIRVRGVIESGWSERGISARNAPPAGDRLPRTGRLPSNRRVRIDVTRLITGNGIFSLALTSGNEKPIEIFSTESGIPPRLEILTAPKTAPVVAAAGDIACDPAMRGFRNGFGTPTACRMLATSDTLLWNQHLIDRILLLGDTQYEDGSLEQFLASYDRNWGRVRSKTSPSIGNHEYQTPGGQGYFDYFGASAGPAELGYYDFELGDWHVIALNSQCGEVGGCAEGSPQLEWLRAKLTASLKPCTLAYWHIPRFSSGRHGASGFYDDFWKVLHAAGAEIILNGHDHVYERFAPMNPDGDRDGSHGLRQFTVGTGGKNLHGWVNIHPHSQVRNNQTFGSLELELRSDGYSWRFLPQAGQLVIDKGSDACHGAP